MYYLEIPFLMGFSGIFKVWMEIKYQLYKLLNLKKLKIAMPQMPNQSHVLTQEHWQGGVSSMMQ